MTHDDVIEMAKKSGFWINDDGSFSGGDDSHGLLVFAGLIAAFEAQKCADLCLELAPGEDGRLCADAILERYK
jgi:hypothetical protein